ncbi:hypothetical protein AN189_02860 [Loktanella sp. 3ANDIMAR09]|uniref:hypothetical protein n=1 Tax=Loktanella sp. 3ANDIMAR09 TaxID=1225657 RepID=UPI0006F34ECB|nr:hypothetical protein [Loktanella sp. 3ANDIMAR09]KQI69382.1 hypothetical protein AN189_02860 [Loktanella sp. 3ANDIMAR09]
MTKPTENFTGVRAKLAAHKAAHHGTTEKTLPRSGITAQIPEFINHGAWMLAQRQAKGDVPRAQAAFIIGTVKFEGEKLTMADVQNGLIDAKDMLFLIGEVFGDEDEDAGDDPDDVDAVGNEPKAD